MWCATVCVLAYFLPGILQSMQIKSNKIVLKYKREYCLSYEYCWWRKMATTTKHGVSVDYFCFNCVRASTQIYKHFFLSCFFVRSLWPLFAFDILLASIEWNHSQRVECVCVWKTEGLVNAVLKWLECVFIWNIWNTWTWTIHHCISNYMDAVASTHIGSTYISYSIQKYLI